MVKMTAMDHRLDNSVLIFTGRESYSSYINTTMQSQNADTAFWQYFMSRSCKAKRQYLLTSQVSINCLFAIFHARRLQSQKQYNAYFTSKQIPPLRFVVRIHNWAPVVVCVNRSLPSKREELNQCCFIVGPASKTVGQHWNSIGRMPRVCWIIMSSEPTLSLHA